MMPAKDGVPQPEPAPEGLKREHFEDGRLSIAVFGPGEGEAIVVRLPDGRVGVVDGCREPQPKSKKGTGDPVRELLNELEVQKLEFVCLTHPHEDHYRGLGRLLIQFEGNVRHIWYPEYSPGYTKALLAYLEKKGGPESQSSTKGLERVLARFDPDHSSKSCEIYSVKEKTELWNQVVATQQLVLKSCGPAGEDVAREWQELINCIQCEAEGKSIPGHGFDPNRTSIALQIHWGGTGVLLAGDLICAERVFWGWDKMHAKVNSPIQVIKVAHHASHNAHHEELWKRIKPRLAIITPFMKAQNNQPPRPEQIAKIAETSVVAITSPPVWVDKLKDYGLRVPGLAGVVGSAGTKDIRNAVLVSLNDQGEITKLVLAGEAAMYERTDEGEVAQVEPIPGGGKTSE
jgi:beta-lactamase superfamily II metal-dependent hydrolase